MGDVLVIAALAGVPAGPAAPAQVPVPGIAGCFLLNTMDLLLVTPPPQLSGVTVYAQAAKQHFTTIGFTVDLTLTQGLQPDS